MKASAVKILMLVENHFPQDTRVKNEATLLTDAGYQGLSHRASKKRPARTRNRERCSKFTVVPQLELFKKTRIGNLSRLRPALA